MHMAFNALHLRNATKAVNAGVNLMLSGVTCSPHRVALCARTPACNSPTDLPCSSSMRSLPGAALGAAETPAAFRKTGMLAADGRCKTLDASADGYVRAEALGAVLLELLADAGRQPPSAGGSPALALLLGSAVNQDGRSSTLTAPNGPAQQAVVRLALAAAGLAASQLAVIQLHGTGVPQHCGHVLAASSCAQLRLDPSRAAEQLGHSFPHAGTSLGDPIELGALAAVLEGSTPAAPLIINAGKSLIGHSEPAAGVMGIAHAQLAIGLAASLPLLHLHSGGPTHLRVLPTCAARVRQGSHPHSHCGVPWPQSTPTLHPH